MLMMKPPGFNMGPGGNYAGGTPGFDFGGGAMLPGGMGGFAGAGGNDPLLALLRNMMASGGNRFAPGLSARRPQPNPQQFDMSALLPMLLGMVGGGFLGGPNPMMGGWNNYAGGTPGFGFGGSGGPGATIMPVPNQGRMPVLLSGSTPTPMIDPAERGISRWE